MSATRRVKNPTNNMPSPLTRLIDILCSASCSAHTSGAWPKGRSGSVASAKVSPLNEESSFKNEDSPLGNAPKPLDTLDYRQKQARHRFGRLFTALGNETSPFSRGFRTFRRGSFPLRRTEKAFRRGETSFLRDVQTLARGLQGFPNLRRPIGSERATLARDVYRQKEHLQREQRGRSP